MKIEPKGWVEPLERQRGHRKKLENTAKSPPTPSVQLSQTINNTVNNQITVNIDLNLQQTQPDRAHAFYSLDRYPSFLHFEPRPWWSYTLNTPKPLFNVLA